MVQGQYVLSETDEDFAERLESGFCRRKCANAHGPVRHERGKPSLDGSIPMHTLVGEGVVLRAVPKDLTWRSVPYREFIRTLPCLNPLCRSGLQSDAHHEQAKGHGGKSITCGDDRCLPLCPLCHVPIRHTRGRSIWLDWGIDVEKTILNLNEQWMRQGGALKGSVLGDPPATLGACLSSPLK